MVLITQLSSGHKVYRELGNEFSYIEKEGAGGPAFDEAAEACFGKNKEHCLPGTIAIIVTSGHCIPVYDGQNNWLMNEGGEVFKEINVPMKSYPNEELTA